MMQTREQVADRGEQGGRGNAILDISAVDLRRDQVSR
jgi:hypothetical protein